MWLIIYIIKNDIFSLKKNYFNRRMLIDTSFVNSIYIIKHLKIKNKISKLCMRLPVYKLRILFFLFSYLYARPSFLYSSIKL